jgi:methionyl-tRNA synthetase
LVFLFTYKGGLVVYLTTAIDYPNALPHIGTAFEKIGADIYARWERERGKKVFLRLGNDENTIKVFNRAKELNLEPQAYVDRMALEFQQIWDALGVSYDDFIQTTEQRHQEQVEEFITKCHERGDIYKKKYKGWYCEGCEEFKISAQKAPKCLTHGTDLKWTEEENWFFSLSKYKNFLLDFYAQCPTFISPEHRKAEILNMCENLKDISISRRDYGWGIPVPFDREQTIYVWFDALLNYLTDSDGKWPADIHFVGKDITRFHCILWPAMLQSAGIELPKSVFAHGFIHSKGRKEAKSDSPTNPLDIINEYGSDAYRYYFTAHCPFGADSEYSPEHFREVYNADLAKNLGNFISRVATMVQKFKGELKLNTKGVLSNAFFKEYNTHMTTCDYAAALGCVIEYIDSGNKNIQTSRTWEGLESQSDNTKASLEYLCQIMEDTAKAILPFMPRASKEITTFLERRFHSNDLDYKPDALFPRK